MSRKQRVRRRRSRCLFHESLEPRQLLNADPVSSWQNPENPLDVNQDGEATPYDALLIANELDRTGGGPLGDRGAASELPLWYPDTNGDGALTEADFDAVAAHLNGSGACASSGGAGASLFGESEGSSGGSGSGSAISSGSISASGSGSASGSASGSTSSTGSGSGGGSCVISFSVESGGVEESLHYHPFTVRYTGSPCNHDVSVTLTSAGDDLASTHKATPGATADFVPDSQTFTFTPSEMAASTTKQFTVIVENDSVVEYAQETYKVSWSWTDENGNGQTQAMYPVIVDDDQAHYSIESEASNTSCPDEGSGGAPGTFRQFTIRFDNPVDIPVAVTYSTFNITATAGSDYADVGMTTATIPAGSTTFHFSVSVVADTVIEADEEFGVVLWGATTSDPISEPRAISDGSVVSVTAPIKNDDEGVLRLVTQNPVTGAYEVVSGPVERSEGAGAFQFRVGLFKPSTNLPTTADVDVMINYATSNGTAIAGGTALHQQDFTAAAGQLPISAGQSAVDLPGIAINDDGFVELSEEFSLAVTVQNSGRKVGGSPSGTCRILDNDGNTNVSIGDVVVGEPTGGFVNVVFVVAMSKPVDYPVSISYSFTDVTATNGANGDYSASPGQVVIPAGVTYGNITVRVYHDNVSGEGAETFEVHLSLGDDGGRAVYFSDPIAVGTIYDY